MIYFYMWVLFLVSIVFAVPIVAYVEKSRLKKAGGDMAAAGSQAGDAGVSFDDEPAEVAASGDELGEFGEGTTAAADDFSAFEDFK